MQVTEKNRVHDTLQALALKLKPNIMQNKRLRRIISPTFWKKLAISIVRYAIVICILFIIIYPFIAYISNSFKSVEDLTDISVNFIPKNPSTEIFSIAIKAMQYQKTFINSLLLSLFVAALQVLASTFIGYGFGRFRFPGRKLLYAFVIITLLIPPQTLMVPEYFKFRFFDFFGIIESLTGQSLNFINTWIPFGALSISGFGLKNGLYIFLMTQFFERMPMELEEAAMVDGAGFFKIFYRIMAPNAIPMMATVFLFSFSWQWTDTYFTSLFLSDWKVLPMAAGSIAAYQVNIIEPVVRSAASNAAVLLIIAPLIALYAFAQKMFIQGIEKSGLVG